MAPLIDYGTNNTTDHPLVSPRGNANSASGAVEGGTHESDASPNNNLWTEATCPLLKDVSIDRLPPGFQRRLLPSPTTPPPCGSENDGSRNYETNVVFYPGYIPMAPWILLLSSLFWSACFAGVVWCLWKDYLGDRVFLEIGLMVVAGVLGTLVPWLWTTTVRNNVQRAPLRAKNPRQSGCCATTKPWPGDWKPGVYLVGTHALVDYNGSKAWWFPVDQILNIHSERMKGRHLVSIQHTWRNEATGANHTTTHLLWSLVDPAQTAEAFRAWHLQCLATPRDARDARFLADQKAGFPSMP